LGGGGLALPLWVCPCSGGSRAAEPCLQEGAGSQAQPVPFLAGCSGEGGRPPESSVQGEKGNEQEINIRGWHKSSEADRAKMGRSPFEEARRHVHQQLHGYL